MSYEVGGNETWGGYRARQAREYWRSETGSALLIVFLFAAIVAITLYMELPVAAFEAERNREQLVIDRGNEYAHAVKLFVRKFGMYPASLDQLENTNRMRFLRHRFKDPLTGKDDWRLLHAGPNGQLLDSKISPISKVSNGADSNSGAGSAESSAANSSAPAAGGGFNSAPTAAASSTVSASTGTGGGGFNSDSSSTPSEVVVPPVPQRPPAIAASGNRGPAGASQAEQDPTTPLLSTNQGTNAASTAQNGSSAPGVQPAQPNDQNATQTAAQNGAEATAAQGSAQGAGANGIPNGMATIRSLLTNPNSPQSTSSKTGVITSGGIAGVASKAEGHSIKTVNDQSEYALWEFYYDPTKDAMRGIANALQAGGAQSGQIGGRNPAIQNSSIQGSPTAGASAGTSSAPVQPPEAIEPQEPPEANENPPQ